MRTADIDALARLLDGEPAPDGEVSAEARLLSSLAQAMESRAAGAMRADFRDELRATLLSEAAKPVPPTFLERTRMAFDERVARLRYSAKMATATGMAAMTLSTGGVAAATTMAVPGDLFYPVKLTVEDLRLGWADGSLDRAAVLLAHTEHRISEAERAAQADRHGSAEEALVAADASLRDAAAMLIGAYLDSGDREALQPLEDLHASVSGRLTALEGSLTGGALHALENLQTTFSRIAERIAAVTGGCCGDAAGAGPGIPSSGSAFDFTRIPPAHEPFVACPCPTSGAGATIDPDTGLSTPPADPTEPPADGDATTPTPPPADGTSPEPPPGSTDDPVGDILPAPVQEAVDPLRDVLDNVIDDVRDPLKPVTDPVEDIIDAVTDPLKDATAPVTDPLEDATKSVTDPLKNALEPVTDPLKDAVAPITDPLGDATDPLGGATDPLGLP